MCEPRGTHRGWEGGTPPPHCSRQGFGASQKRRPFNLKVMESLKDVKEGSNTIKCTDYEDCYYAVVFTTKFESDSGALDRVTSLTVGLFTERGSLGAVRAQQPHPQVSCVFSHGQSLLLQAYFDLKPIMHAVWSCV